MKKIEQKVGTLNKTIVAACVLHNVYIALNDTYDLDESDSDEDDSVMMMMMGDFNLQVI